MPYSGGGVFTLTPGYTAVTGQTILPSQHNPPLEDIASSLNLAFLRDGRAAATGNWNLGGNRITNLGGAVDPADAATKAQISDLSGLRNVLINGTFFVNQRGVSGTVTLAAGAYGHDRWKAGAGGCTYTFSTSNGLVVLNITAGTLVQVVEATCFAGRPGSYVLSWTGSAQGRINGGSYGSSGGVSASLAPTANATVEFSTGILCIPQLELGLVTSFSIRHIQQEVAFCQRYFQFVNFNLSFNASASNELLSVPLQLPVVMRIIPTIGGLQTDPEAGGSSNQNNGLNQGFARGRSGFSLLLQSNTAGQSFLFGYRFPLDAEL